MGRNYGRVGLGDDGPGRGVDSGCGSDTDSHA